jgi:hypothetical protein
MSDNRKPILPTILPPSDLLEQIEGVEKGLYRARRLGLVGWAGILLSLLRIIALLVNSQEFANLQNLDWRQPLQHWPWLILVAVFVLSLFLVSWTRFWLNESQSPFRYTYSIADFEAVEADQKLDKFVWLPHDLANMLNTRIGRLFLLDEECVEGAPQEAPESHIHIRGHYLIRQMEADWVIEVMPQVRIGPRGNPETLAHKVRFTFQSLADLAESATTVITPPSSQRAATSVSASPSNIEDAPANEAQAENAPPDQKRDQRADQNQQDNRPDRQQPPALEADQYGLLLERVYFSVASQIYKQIRQDVQNKIDLLPTDQFRAAAYFYEAEDYAQSNTLDAYDEAAKLYLKAMQSYEPRWLPTAASSWRRWVRRIGSSWVNGLRLVKRRGARVWPGLGRREVMAARAELGYANVLLYRRILAGLSGRWLNPIFEVPLVVDYAVRRLESLPADVPDRSYRLFDGYVTKALALNYLSDYPQAKDILEKGRRLMPGRAEQDARYLFAAGEIDARLQAELLFFRRAVELEPTFEAAQFQLATKTEVLWRSRPDFEHRVAKLVFEEYQKVLNINPGNLAAWQALGDLHWLLDRRTEARPYFEKGREFKEIKQETFVAELDDGLARIAAENGDFEQAYKYYSSGNAAEMAQSGYRRSQYIARKPVNAALMDRYKCLKKRVQDHLAAAQEQAVSELPSRRVREAVKAFVLNEYGVVCYLYYLDSGDERGLEEAYDAFEQAKDDDYVMPYFNLASLQFGESRYRPDRIELAKENIEKVCELEPTWPDGKLLGTEIFVAWAPEAQKNAERLRATASEQAATDQKQDEVIYSKKSGAEFQEPDTGQSISQSEQNSESKKREAEAQEIEAEARRLSKWAVEFVRNLLPHQWLWVDDKQANGWSINQSALRRTDFETEWRWKKELDDLHVAALFTWAKIILLQAQQYEDEGEKNRRSPDPLEK